MNFKFWKHKTNQEVIAHECYNKLPQTYQSFYEPTHEEPTHKVDDDNSSFGTSFLMAEITGSAALGYASGGDFLGAEIGSMMSSDNSSSFDSGSSFSGFDGGSSGGGGADGSW